MNIRDHVDGKRRFMGLSIYKLAQLAGVRHGPLYKWFNHKQGSIKSSDLDKIFTVLKIKLGS